MMLPSVSNRDTSLRMVTKRPRAAGSSSAASKKRRMACTGERHGERARRDWGVRGAAQQHDEKVRGDAQERRKTRKQQEHARELREHALEGEAREGRGRGVRGCTGSRGGREGAQHESAQTAESTQKARGKRAARAGTHQRGSGRGAEMCKRARRRFSRFGLADSGFNLCIQSQIDKFCCVQ